MTKPTTRAERVIPARILIAGFGSIGKRHARLIRAMLPEVELAVLRHQQTTEPLAAGMDHCFTSLEQALAFQPQAAVIANPSSHHLPVALALAEAGVHLLIEKPIASSAEGVRDLIDICRKQQLVLMTAYNLRFMPSLLRFRELLQSKVVGAILNVRAEVGQYLPEWRPGTDYRTSVSARAELGGGVLLELSHELDYLRWLFGEVQWVSAVLRTQSKLEINVEDMAGLTLGLKGNDGSKELIASLNLDCFRRDTTRTCTVIGDAGTMRWNAISGQVELFRSRETGWENLYSQGPMADESYKAQWQHFMQCMAGKAVPAVSGEDAPATLLVIEAARRSSAMRATVTPAMRITNL